MKSFHNFSLKTKLVVVCMLTCLPVLFLTALFFVTNERATYRKELIHNISTLAEVVGINSTASLVFQDPETAKETLAALSAEPNIVAACILGQDENVFASYLKAPDGAQPVDVYPYLQIPPGFIEAGAAGEKHQFSGGSFVLTRPVLFRNASIGQVFIRVDLAGFHKKQTWYAAIVLAVLLGAVVLAFFLSSRLQLLISRPIMNLADKVGIISRESNYSIRAERAGDDEIGTLINGFNQMLDQIEKRDVELAAHRDNLEEQVAERTIELARAVDQLQTEMAERKRTQKALRQSETRYREMFENMSNGVAIYRPSPDGREFYLIDLNKAAEKIVQVNRDQILGQELGDVFPAFSASGFDDVLRSVWQDGHPMHVPATLYDDERIVVWLESFVYKLVTKDVVVIFSDESDRKKAEAEKNRMEKQLLRAQKMEAIGMLAGGVAHDLNNILSGILSYPELLLFDMEDDDPIREPLETIQQSGHRAAAIVQDLLTLARRGVAVTENISLSEIISDYLKSPEFKKLLTYHPKVRVMTELDNETYNVLGSPVHLSKTVMNLTSNAAEAMPDGGTVTISLSHAYVDTPLPGYDAVEPGDFVVLRVADEGIGIEPSDLERIFEPFYTKKVMGRSGTGLGMAVVWGTVRDHHGYIDVNSIKGQGTVFTLYIPAAGKPKADHAPSGQQALPKGNGETILIIDDVKEQRIIARNILQRLGYEAQSVDSGEAALTYMQRHRAPDLLLLDMIMDPGIDGYETYRRILNASPGQKAIIASGFSESSQVSMTQELGAGQYVKKPYSMEQLAIAVHSELNR